jgi:hypothetical protein
VGFSGPSGGYASVIVDGVAKTASLSFYSGRDMYRKTLWSVAGLAPGTHTLQVVPRGTKPAGSRGTWVYVDAFNVGAAVIQDNDPKVTEQFSRLSAPAASGASYDLTSHVAASGWSSPTLTFQFSGTGVTWSGTTGPTYGKATVFIDNVSQGKVDLYRSSLAYRQNIWSSAGLSDGLHTIRIAVTGRKRAASKGFDVSFDEFVIR